MNMKKYIKYISAVLIAGFLLSSCDDKLNVTNPNSLTDDQITDLLKNGTDEQRDMILGGLASALPANMSLRNSIIYAGFSNMGYDSEFALNLIRDLQGEDIVYADRNSSLGTSWGGWYYNQKDFSFWDGSNVDWCFGYWAGPATIINNANKVSQFLTDDVIAQSTKLKDYKARCLTIHAMGYMELMERFQKAYLYGGKEGKGMPIYTTFAYNDPVAPLSATETYDFIKSELVQANKLFLESGIGASGYTVGTTQDQVYDIDRGISQYLLARVSLWTGDYTTCIASCKEILEHYPNFIKEANYGMANDSIAKICANKAEVYSDNNAFLSVAKNPECMFGWTNDSNLYPWTYLNIFSASSGGYGQGYFQINDALYNKIADNDYRKSRFVTDTISFPYFVTQGKTNVVIPEVIYKMSNLKWAATIASDQTARTTDKQNSDVILIRSSEVLLMLAEAQATSGDEAGAKATLNKLLAARTKAGATTLTCDNYPAMKGLSALDMVKLQWRIEMWAENGLDFFNHKRWNQDITRTGSTNHWSTNGLSVDHMTWEIPDKETQTNPNW